MQRLASFSNRYALYKNENQKYFPEESGVKVSGAPAEIKEQISTEHSKEYQQLLELDNINKHAEERSQQIMHLATQTMELASLFKSLDAMIKTDGEVINRIDFNISNALEHSQHAVSELQEAKKIQDKNTSTKALLGVGALVGALTGALVLKKLKS